MPINTAKRFVFSPGVAISTDSDQEGPHEMDRIEPARSLMDLTADRVRQAIIAGELPLGSKLSEQRLAETPGVSRSPVRDALAFLQYEGLVEVLPKVGSFVFTPDMKTALDLCEHRAVLETASLRMAITRNRDQLIDQLSRHAQTMETAILATDPKAYTRGDMEFHNAIISCGGNRSMAKAYSHTIGPLKALRTHLFIVLHSELERSMTEHGALIQACRDANADLAAKILQEHITHLIEDYQASDHQTPAPQHAGRAI